jgi:hypothetical protein
MEGTHKMNNPQYIEGKIDALKESIELLKSANLKREDFIYFLEGRLDNEQLALKMAQVKEHFQ